MADNSPIDNSHSSIYNAHMDKHRFLLVLPGELWERLKALAKRNRRTVTAESLIAIEKHLEQDAKEKAR